MRGARLIAAAILVVSLPACLSLTAERTYNPRFDFAGATTYDWAVKEPELGPEFPYEFLDGLIREAVDEKLADKGFTRSTEDPSFRITYYLGAEEVADISDDYYSYGWGGYWGYGWYGPTGVNVSQYDETSITIDILSSGPGAGLVWRGVGKGTIDLTASERRVRRVVSLTVDKILDEFPPDLD